MKPPRSGDATRANVAVTLQAWHAFSVAAVALVDGVQRRFRTLSKSSSTPST